MTYIYSEKQVERLKGAYIAPFRFKQVEKDAKVVYTDNKQIKESYEKVECEVLPITKPKRRVKKD